MKQGKATWEDYKKAKRIIEMHRPTFLINKEAFPKATWVYVETALSQNKYKFDSQIDKQIQRYVYIGSEGSAGM